MGSSTAVTVQIYLSIHRADLARKELEQAKRWSEDDLLLQHIEATISLATGADGYADCNSFYTEQLANPSLSSPHLFTARGVTRILLGEVAAAKSDLEEVQTKDAETLAALIVAEELTPTKGTEKGVEQLWRYVYALNAYTCGARADVWRCAVSLSVSILRSRWWWMYSKSRTCLTSSQRSMRSRLLRWPCQHSVSLYAKYSIDFHAVYRRVGMISLYMCV